MVAGREYVRHPLSKGLGCRNTGSMGSIDNHFDLPRVLALTSQWNKKEKQKDPTPKGLPRRGGQNNKTAASTHLHRLSIDQQSIQILRGLGSRLRLAENDVRNSAAAAILVVGEDHSLHRACRFGEVFL